MSTSDKYTNNRAKNPQLTGSQPTREESTSDPATSASDQTGEHQVETEQIQQEQIQQMIQVLDAARNEHFQAGLSWVYQDENCLQDNWIIRQYADGTKLLVELSAQGKENIIKQL